MHTHDMMMTFVITLLDIFAEKQKEFQKTNKKPLWFYIYQIATRHFKLRYYRLGTKVSQFLIRKFRNILLNLP